jgi:hypothetical protein
MNHAVRRLVRIRVHEDRVDYAEDGGRGSDAEGEGEYRGQGEARSLNQLPDAVAQVLYYGFHGLPDRSVDERSIRRD